MSGATDAIKHIFILLAESDFPSITTFRVRNFNINTATSDADTGFCCHHGNLCSSMVSLRVPGLPRLLSLDGHRDRRKLGQCGPLGVCQRTLGMTGTLKSQSRRYMHAS